MILKRASRAENTCRLALHATDDITLWNAIMIGPLFWLAQFPDSSQSHRSSLVLKVYYLGSPFLSNG